MAASAQSVLGRRSVQEGAEVTALDHSRFPLWVIPVAALCLLAIYVVGYDQGGLLYLVLGQDSMRYNYVHEFVHDGRHLLAFACH